jgi:hypothetical protein
VTDFIGIGIFYRENNVLIIMTALTISRDKRADWITPQEQLERLALVEVKKRLYRKKEEVPKSFYDRIDWEDVVRPAIRSVLRRSNLSKSNAIPKLQDLCVDHLMGPLPSSLTEWYTARERLGILPEKLPPLPWNIDQILNSKCPVYGDEKKEDGTHYTVKETHVLQLLCEEDGSINQFEKEIRAHWKKYPSLRFRIFNPAARQEYGNLRFEPSHWELLTTDILPKSRKLRYPVQIAQIHSLSQKSFVHYEIPSLQNVSRTTFLHKVATNENLYSGNHVRGPRHTLTRVKDETYNGAFCFGAYTGFDGPGVYILCSGRQKYVGVAARRRIG